MKKLIRAALKLPLTPLYLTYKVSLIIFGTVIIFFEWLYDYDNQIYRTRDMLKEELIALKGWFTKI